MTGADFAYRRLPLPGRAVTARRPALRGSRAVPRRPAALRAEGAVFLGCFVSTLDRAWGASLSPDEYERGTRADWSVNGVAFSFG